MKILILAKYSRLGASSRIRLLQYVPIFKKNGIKVDVNLLLNREYLEKVYAGKKPNFFNIIHCYLLRTFRLIKSKKYDYLIIEKELYPGFPHWFEQLLKHVGVKYILDYDDAIFLNYSNFKNRVSEYFLSDKIAKVMQNAHAVVTCNKYLAEYAKDSGAKFVRVIPTAVDIDRYTVSLNTNKTITIGWIGSPSTVKYLEKIIPYLEDLNNELCFNLKIVGAKLQSKCNLNVIYNPWTEAAEAKLINSMDIGIMPLEKEEWAKGKCAYKLIQYMAGGLPTVATNFGANSKVVEHGKTGYLVSELWEWKKFLKELIIDKRLRETMGNFGRNKVEKFYCIQNTAYEWLSLFKTS